MSDYDLKDNLRMCHLADENIEKDTEIVTKYRAIFSHCSNDIQFATYIALCESRKDSREKQTYILIVGTRDTNVMGQVEPSHEVTPNAKAWAVKSHTVIPDMDMHRSTKVRSRKRYLRVHRIII